MLSRLLLLLVLCSAVSRSQVSAQTPAAVAAASACKTYRPQGLPLSGNGPLVSTIAITDAFDVTSVAVKSVALQAGRVAPLKISLSTGVPQSPTGPLTVVLKDVRAGGDASAFNEAGFTDTAITPLPTPAPGPIITGDYQPTQALSALAQGSGTTSVTGGSQGVWVLRIINLSAKDMFSITLLDWALELCTATTTPTTTPTTTQDPTMRSADAPPVSASAGPTDTTTTPTSTPTTSTPTATPTAVNGTKAPPGVLEELLDRLNNLGDNSLLGGNRTTVLRDTLLGSANDTLLDRLNTRISEILAPLNDTLLVRSLNNTPSLMDAVTNARQRINQTAANSNSTGLLGSAGAFRSALNGSTVNQQNVDRFVTAFRNLVDLATGPNTSLSTNATTFRTIMAQSGVDLDNATAATLPGLISKLGSGQLLQNLGNGDVWQVLTRAYQQMNLGVLQRQAQSTGGQNTTASPVLGSRLASGLNATGLGSGALFRSTPGSAAETINEQLKTYWDMMASGTNLVTSLIKRSAQQQQNTTSSLATTLRSAITELGKMPSTSGRESLIQSLTRQMQSAESSAQKQNEFLGSQLPAAVSDFFNTYLNQIQSASKLLTGVASSGTTAGGNSQTRGQSASSAPVLNAVLDTINQGLKMYQSSSSTPTGQALSAWASGLDSLQTRLQALQRNINAVTATAGTAASNARDLTTLLNNITTFNNRWNALRNSMAQKAL